MKGLITALVALPLVLLAGCNRGDKEAARAATDDQWSVFEQALGDDKAGVIVDIRALPGHTPAEVEALLGAAGPWSCETSRYSRRCTYPRGNTEVVYVNDKATWFTVSDLDNAALDDQLLTRFGLKAAAPGDKADGQWTWHDVQGFKAIVAVSLDGKHVDHLLVKAV